MSKVSMTCEVCGTTFLIDHWRLKHDVRFCSMACRNKAWSGENNPNWKGGPETRICLECGESFELIMSPSVISMKGRGQFCSRECHYAWRRKHGERGSEHKNWRSKIVEKICPVCGKTFQVQIAPCGVGDNKFCSHECWREGRIGAGNPCWRGGKSPEPYPLEFSEELKEAVRERDDNCCQICQATKEQNGQLLDVHHIDGNKQNNSPDNLITLCKSCHTKVHMGSLQLCLQLRLFL